MKPTHFCKACRKPCNLKQHDFGIGPGEAHGQRFNHVDLATVTTCCESEDFFESAEEFREYCQDELGLRLERLASELLDTSGLTQSEIERIDGLCDQIQSIYQRKAEKLASACVPEGEYSGEFLESTIATVDKTIQRRGIDLSNVHPLAQICLLSFVRQI